MGKAASPEVIASHYWSRKEQASWDPWLWSLSKCLPAHPQSQLLYAAPKPETPLTPCVEEACEKLKEKDVASDLPRSEVQHPMDEPAPLPCEACTYRIRGSGFRAFDLEAQPSETVEDFRERVGRFLQPGAPPSLQVQLSCRSREGGGLLELHGVEQAALICQLVPTRSALNVRLLGLPAPPAPSDPAELRALRAEGKMLHWEASRLRRELHGLHVLLQALSKHTLHEKKALPALAEPSFESTDAKNLRQQNDELRAANKRLLNELASMDSLVTRIACKGTERTRDIHRAWRGPVVRGIVTPMPPDGSCLFHALASGLGMASSGVLRDEICDFIAHHPDATLAGKTLSDWVLWDTGKLPKEYAEKMRDPTTWGGMIEMAVCSLIKKADVHVYLETAGGGFQRICAFDEAGEEALRTVSLAHTPGHFDLFEVQTSQE